MEHPLLYEINTRCWLRELSDKHNTRITLANVPELLFVTWQKMGFTHIWLMGVWSSGERSRAQALAHPYLLRNYAEVLPDWRPEDVTGSPYAIAEYRVPEALGGEAGLQQFRTRLHQQGMQLILDFVPNHLGVDHPWISQRPELFVQSPHAVPETFRCETSAGPRWIAHGKDPFFPAWTDTAQLDYRLPATCQAMTDLLLSVAERCDGVRCDMAMLLLSEVFAKTWQHVPCGQGSAAGPAATEFWAAALSSVRAACPNFVFLAEIYWGLEPRLQALGFDFTYDKALYDEIVARDSWAVHHHLQGHLPQFIAASAHFLENHDEPRIAALLSPAEHRAAALLILGLPGMRFLHEGQLSGARQRIPVQLARRCHEPVDLEIEKIYVQMLATLARTAVGRGKAELLKPRPAWPENPTAQNFTIIRWQNQPQTFDLVIVNLAPHPSQCRVHLSVAELGRHAWSLKDLLGTEEYRREGPELERDGLYLDLPAYGAQLFRGRID